MPFPKTTNTSLRDSLIVFKDENIIEHPVEKLIKKVIKHFKQSLNKKLATRKQRNEQINNDKEHIWISLGYSDAHRKTNHSKVLQTTLYIIV